MKCSKITKINLGCGRNYLKGYINIDINKSLKADKYFNLNKFPYPFPDNYAEEVLLDNVLEHLEDVFRVVGEVHRILKQDGILEIFVPYAKSDGALQDPTHKHLFTEKSMDYLISGSGYDYYSNCKFKILTKQLSSANKTRLSKIRILIPFKFIFKYVLFNMYDQVYFRLQALK